MSIGSIDTAMVLAAGRGTRMRPITERIPKPLVEVAGRTLIDRALDALVRAGIGRVVVNVHHLADLLDAHLAARTDLEIEISDEREQLLDSAGGIVHALPRLGNKPFFVLNADTFWIEGEFPELCRLASVWQPEEMDILLMLVDPRRAHGHVGPADFVLEDGRRLRRAGASSGLIYAGAGILDPGIFADATPVPHSLNFYFDRAIASGRLHGMPMESEWITVGAPEAIGEADKVLAERSCRASG